MIKVYQKFHRSIAMLCIASLLISGCDLTPAVPPAVNEATLLAQTFLQSYQAEFSLRPRPADTAQGAAEAYMQRYQPGPTPRINTPRKPGKTSRLRR